MRGLKSIKYLRLLLIASFFTGSAVYAQQPSEGSVGIGTIKPDESAILDLNSKSKGLLLPRLTLTERSNIKNPAVGLMVYQTNILKGLYVYDGQRWGLLAGGETSGAKLTTSADATWFTYGNTGTNTDENFIGTTDENSLLFKVNNFNSGLIDLKRGLTTLGYKAGYLSSGYNSVILGALAMQKSNTSGNNVSIGYQSLFSVEKGDHNVAVGSGVLAANLESEKNTAVGSLAGYKSTGNSNVFLGFQAGYFEAANNKLHIGNDASRVPLIYGDFETGKVGINTTTLGSALNINSGVNNSSGLKFEKLSSNSPTIGGNQKVLTVNSSGEVILVPDYYESTTTYWNASGNDISNSNAGLVNIGGSMNVANGIKANSMSLGAGGLTINNLGDATGKFLSLASNGALVLVNAPSIDLPVTESTTVGSTEWTRAGNDITNANGGIVNISQGLRFANLNAGSEVSSSNSKVLSLDQNGNVVLVEDQKGSVTLSGDNNGIWSIDNNNQIYSNGNLNVKISQNLNVDNTIFAGGILTKGLGVGEHKIKFLTMNSSSPTVASNGKVLSLDAQGNVILVPDVSGGTTTTTTTTPVTATTTVINSPWVENGGVMYTQNDDKVIIGHGINNLPQGYRLYVKDGILAERVRVAVANSDKWADYVFEEGYDLMPLNAVEKFIKNNKHLPNVPSAQEVASEGLDLAEITAKQMEKIEELTLYLIQTQKQLKAANERINALEIKMEQK